MKHTEEDIIWYDSLNDTREDGYFPIKVTSLLQFYALRGKTNQLSASNIEPIRYLHYTVFSPTDKRFYFKMFRHYPLNDLYFNRRSLTYSGESEELTRLRRYAFDGNVSLLFSKSQVDNTNAMMERAYHGNLSWQGEFKRNDFYKLFFRILHQQLQYDDFLDYGKNLTGFKTTCNLMREQIQELWKEAYELRIEPLASP